MSMLFCHMNACNHYLKYHKSSLSPFLSACLSTICLFKFFLNKKGISLCLFVGIFYIHLLFTSFVFLRCLQQILAGCTVCVINKTAVKILTVRPNCQPWWGAKFIPRRMRRLRLGLPSRSDPCSSLYISSFDHLSCFGFFCLPGICAHPDSQTLGSCRWRCSSFLEVPGQVSLLRFGLLWNSIVYAGEWPTGNLQEEKIYCQHCLALNIVGKQGLENLRWEYNTIQSIRLGACNPAQFAGTSGYLQSAKCFNQAFWIGT